MAYESKYTCGDCSHVFYKLTDHDPRKVKGRRPACPECRKSKKIAGKVQGRVNGNMSAADVEELRQTKKIEITPGAPAIHSSTGFRKAMDFTAKMVMEDYGLTNLRDNLREGDNMVMPLSGKGVDGQPLEAKVDNMFKPQKNNVAGVAGQQLNSAIKAKINSGAFKDYGDVVQMQNTYGKKPPVTYVGEYDGKA